MTFVLAIATFLAILAGMIVFICFIVGVNDYEELLMQDYECPQCQEWAIPYYNGKQKGKHVIRIVCPECGYYEDIVVSRRKNHYD